MPAPLTSSQCRLKAEEAEQMAKTCSYRPDRERYAREAQAWRLKEADALAREGLIEDKG